MSVCKKCNQQNEGYNKFCVYCGTPLEVQAEQQPQQPIPQNLDQQYMPPAGQYTQPQQQMYYEQPTQQQAMPYPQAPYTPVYDALPIVKRIAGSGLFLATAIIFTLSTVLAVLSPFIGTSDVLATNTGMSASMQQVATAFGVMVGSTVPILHIIGMWLFYSQSRNPLNRSTASFTLHKIGVILVLIGFGLVGLAVPLLLIIGLAASSLGAVGVIVAVIIILLLLIIAVPVIYFVLILRVIGGFKHTIMYGEPKLKSVTAVAVFNFIFAGITLLGVVGSSAVMAFTQAFASEFVSNDMLSLAGISVSSSGIEVMAVVLSSIASILFGVLLLKYKSAVTANTQVQG